MSPVEQVIEGRERDLGGFTVRRVLPSGRRRMVGPFIFFDHMGPADFAPGTGVDVRPHPHIHLATVTYLFEGELLHRDSLGCVQAIRPGAVNWMTAGRGIVHSERTAPEPRASGQRLHGIQAWVALPQDQEDSEPAFVHHPAEGLPRYAPEGVDLCLIAGRAYGLESPVATASPLFYADAVLRAEAVLPLPAGHTERAVYVVDGRMEFAGSEYGPGALLILAHGAEGGLRALQPTRLMLLGGAPLEGDRHIWWNFVSSDPARIEQAKDDWRAGRFANVPGEDEFIPLPDD
jgi:redox-sensitive bicupin YhaK (pirin superfamily)